MTKDKEFDRKYTIEHHIPRFAEFEKYKGKKVLEIGCRDGLDAERFVRAGAIYTGIDASGESVEVTKKRLMNTNVATFTVMTQNIEEWKTDEQFDLIYSFGVLHHASNFHNAMSNIRAMLKPWGEFKMMVHATRSLKNLCIKVGLDAPVARAYTRGEIRTLLSDFDLTITQDHIFQYDKPSYDNYEYVKLPPWDVMPECVTRMMERAFGWHMLVKCVKRV